ncbi:glycoside hydrolase family 17 protein [Botryobasidium botryosum FD-172 SS1]|uniref:glucan endo-1,3-beta-D-glucosidase n=1 Tax=Botryobasidium botryosum (strain FD-172 SS1) TaxID=930990 RepID=A0A067N6F3_BOTB1|nr:glycoside hydrolase family 17 protein [Botryobasidium botryosum FD-172 SS1]
MPSPSYHAVQPDMLDERSDWLRKQQRGSTRTKRIIYIGVAFLLAAIIAIAVGVTVSNNNKHKTSLSSTAGTVHSDPNDPSKFDKDPRLHRSFYGFAYTPLGAQMPSCGATQANVTEDIQLLSQLTPRIRIYGADCNQTALVLQAIQDTKVDMQVYLGIFVDDTDTVYTRQRDAVKKAIQDYGTDHIAGVTVGNEFMLNAVGDNGDATGAAGIKAATYLDNKIADFRSTLKSMNLAKTIPVGVADAGSYFNLQLLSAVDYGMANIHPWFALTTINDAAGWTYDFFQNTNVAQAANAPNHPDLYIAETGWPTKSSDAAHASNGAATASVANLQTFLDTFVCQSNANGTKYFFFEFFDEAWKDAQFGGVEGWWGIFDGNKKLKNVTIPNCVLS